MRYPPDVVYHRTQSKSRIGILFGINQDGSHALRVSSYPDSVVLFASRWRAWRPGGVQHLAKELAITRSA